MKSARKIGNYAEKRFHELGLSVDEINRALDFSDRETYAFFKGRLMLTIDQLSKLADKLGTTVQAMIDGDEKEYSASVVHCMNDFDNEDNREVILDIIDDYMDIRDSLCGMV